MFIKKKLYDILNTQYSETNRADHIDREGRKKIQ